MSKKEKLIKRFLEQPKNFTFDELIRLMGYFDFTLSNKGKTSGSAVSFVKDDLELIIHKPHPQTTLKSYVIKKTITFLRQNNIIK